MPVPCPDTSIYLEQFQHSFNEDPLRDWVVQFSDPASLMLMSMDSSQLHSLPKHSGCNKYNVYEKVADLYILWFEKIEYR